MMKLENHICATTILKSDSGNHQQAQNLRGEGLIINRVLITYQGIPLQIPISLEKNKSKYSRETE